MKGITDLEDLKDYYTKEAYDRLLNEWPKWLSEWVSVEFPAEDQYQRIHIERVPSKVYRKYIGEEE